MFSFQGRSSRLAFLGLSLLAVVLASAGFGVGAAVDYCFWGSSEENRGWLALITLTLMLPGLWMWFAVGVRRCHDLGWSGWWILLRIPTLPGVIQFFWLAFEPGKPRDNRFGQPPGTDPKVGPAGGKAEPTLSPSESSAD